MSRRAEGVKIRRMVVEWSPTCSRAIPERSPITQRALTPGMEWKGMEFPTKDRVGGRTNPKVRWVGLSMRKGVEVGLGEVRA